MQLYSIFLHIFSTLSDLSEKFIMVFDEIWNGRVQFPRTRRSEVSADYQS